MNTDITKQMEMVLYRTEDDNVTVSALIKDENSFTLAAQLNYWQS